MRVENQRILYQKYQSVAMSNEYRSGCILDMECDKCVGAMRYVNFFDSWNLTLVHAGMKVWSDPFSRKRGSDK